MRRQEPTLETTCVGGINQQAEKASLLELADARNVWAPNGKVEVRPGYVGIITIPTTTGSVSGNLTIDGYDTSAASFTGTTLNGLKARTATDGDYWYLGVDTLADYLMVQLVGANSNNTQFKGEYWNGSYWTYLPVTELDVITLIRVAYHLQSTGNDHGFSFCRPQDWAQVAVDGTTAYWLRFSLLSVDFDAAVELADVAVRSGAGLRGLFAPQFPTNKRYILLSLYPTGAVVYVNNASSLNLDGNTTLTVTTTTANTEPATLVVVPQFQEAFIAHDYSVVRITPASSALATVEDQDFAVGSGAPYDKTQIVQLSAFPQAKYLSFFGGRLWSAGLKDEPFTVRWSAATPYHKVWPAGSFEILAEHDNSPITGMAPLGEYMVIYKSDSIWMAYPVGPDPLTGVESFAIKQVVAGTGCVSNSSIKAIRGNHIFLAEDGIYSFDGANVTKLSDPVLNTINAITPGRRPFSTAAHWKSKSLYLLAITTDGSNAANLVVVFDYKNGTWWLWNNIDAQHWLEDEGADDNETLYFGDSAGRIYQLGVGATDHGGAISSYVLTHRFGYGAGNKLRVRGIEAWCSNETSTVTVDILGDDSETATETGTLSFVDANEPTWSDFSYNSGATTDDNWASIRRVVKRIDTRDDSDWFQVKISHSTKNQRFQLSKLSVRYLELGNR